jgi:hypothetical protein
MQSLMKELELRIATVHHELALAPPSPPPPPSLRVCFWHLIKRGPPELLRRLLSRKQ